MKNNGQIYSGLMVQSEEVVQAEKNECKSTEIRDILSLCSEEVQYANVEQKWDCKRYRDMFGNTAVADLSLGQNSNSPLVSARILVEK